MTHFQDLQLEVRKTALRQRESDWLGMPENQKDGLKQQQLRSLLVSF